jgi:hypothetical protein
MSNILIRRLVSITFRIPNLFCIARTVAVLVFVLLYLSGDVLSQEKLVSSDKEGAQRLWELTIQAKGGRARLYKVDSILIESQVDYVTSTGRKNTLRRLNLDVLPNKVWSYEDYGKDVVGTAVLMFNYENMTFYMGTPGPIINTKPMKQLLLTKRFENPQIFTLLESKWLDIQTHLPIEVSFYDAAADGTTRVTRQRFYDYVDVDGIKVPRVLMYSESMPERRGTVDKAVIRFNVDYDPMIFTKAPAVIDSTAWRRSK